MATVRSQRPIPDQCIGADNLQRSSQIRRASLIDTVLHDVDNDEGVTEEIEYIQPRSMRARENVIGQDYARRHYRRRSTDTDPEINIRTAPARRTAAPLPRRDFLKKAMLYGGAGLFGLVTVGSWVNSELVHFNEQLQEGQIPNATINVVVGHHDSAQSPTSIHAYLDNDKITVVEKPGGDAVHSHIFQTSSIRQKYSGDLSQVFISLNAVSLETGYQIILLAKCGGVGVFQSPVTMLWELVDSGKGYFLGVNPKQQ